MNYALTHSVKDKIQSDFQQCRRGTLALFAGMDDTTFRTQIHPEYSPVGWHLAHIGFTENLWLLEHCAGYSPQFPQYRKLLSADGLPKSQRGQIPALSEVYEFLQVIRTKVLDYLKIAPIQEQERFWYFLLQHESQHCETISFLLHLNNCSHAPSTIISDNPFSEMIEIPAGEFEMGNNSINALDNESPSHSVYLDTYWIDRYPVTVGQYQSFILAGGYQNSHWWSKSGWEWQQQNSITQPLYWSNHLPANHPVYGVSWYEAEAYANFVRKRLPTEAEWEKAASWDVNLGCRRTYPWGEEPLTEQHCNHFNIQGKTTPVDAYLGGKSAYGVEDLLGNVWEWTTSWFAGYSGFQSFPYRGYSQAYFDQKHRVLKGGSWATYPWAMRCSFRNWYYPSVREILAGFRCVRDSKLE